MHLATVFSSRLLQSFYKTFIENDHCLIPRDVIQSYFYSALGTSYRESTLGVD